MIFSFAHPLNWTTVPSKFRTNYGDPPKPYELVWSLPPYPFSASGRATLEKAETLLQNTENKVMKHHSLRKKVGTVGLYIRYISYNTVD